MNHSNEDREVDGVKIPAREFVFVAKQ